MSVPVVGERDWPIVVGQDERVAQYWANEMRMKYGIEVRQQDVYTLDRIDRMQGTRCTHIFLTPGIIADVRSIEELMERARKFMRLNRVAFVQRESFKGYWIIGAFGIFNGPTQAL